MYKKLVYALLGALVTCGALGACTDISTTSDNSNTSVTPDISTQPIKADPIHPNREEVVTEEGDVLVPDQTSQGLKIVHYRDEARKVCCVWTGKSPSGYSWLGRDMQWRGLSKEQADKPAVPSNETLTLNVKGTFNPADEAARGAFWGAVGAHALHDYWTSTDPNWPF